MSKTLQTRASSKSTANAQSIVRAALRHATRRLVSEADRQREGAQTEFRVRRLMTPAEVQAALAVSPSWLKRSDIPFIKLGRLRRYHADTVDAYVAARLAA